MFFSRFSSGYFRQVSHFLHHSRRNIQKASYHVDISANRWTPHRFEGRQIYTRHTAHCIYPENQWLDYRFHTPTYMVSYHCEGKKSCVGEVVIARHKNSHVGFKKDDIISMVAILRTGVIDRFSNESKEYTKKTPVNYYYITHNFIDDRRAKFGITTSCLDPNEKAKLSGFLQMIHSIEPIDEEMNNEIEAIMADDFDPKQPVSGRLETFSDLKPVYFQHHENILHWGGVFQRYHSEEDKELIREIPEIHMAILNKENNKIIKMLEENPKLANKKDPWGTEAHDLASDLCSLEIFEYFVEARERCGAYSRTDKSRQDNYYIGIAYAKSNGNDRIGIFFSSTGKESPYKKGSSILARKRVEMTADYFSKELPPEREALHQACIAGNDDLVFSILSDNPTRINEQDPRGYTPLLLAVANGHFKLSEWLIDNHASLDVIESPLPRSGSISLMENAKTPEIIELLMHHGIDPHPWYNDRLIEAIRDHNTTMVKYLLYYYTMELPTYRGLTALEYALQLSEENGPEIVSLMLSHSIENVPQGPYDLHLREKTIEEAGPDEKPTFLDEGSPFLINITPEVVKLLEEHNNRIDQQHAKDLKKPKWQADKILLENQQLIEEFKNENITITSVMKPLSTLCDAELQKVGELFCTNFEFTSLNDNIEDLKKHLYENELQIDKPGNKYINLFYDGDKLVSFIAFELKQSSHPICKGGFTLFHGILGATLPDSKYANCGFASLAFRVPLALSLMQRDHRFYLFTQTLKPGYVLGIFPRFVSFYPKNNIPLDLNKHIANLVGVDLAGKTIPLQRIRVKPRLLPTVEKTERNHVFEYFHHIIPFGDDAMPTILEYTQRNQKLFMDALKYYDIGEREMEKFRTYFKELYLPEYRLVAKL